MPLATVVLPEMASQHARGVGVAVGHLASSALRLVLFVVLPVTALAVGLAPEIADLLFGHGRYDDASVAPTRAAVTVLFLGLPASSLSAFATRALYATERTGVSVAAAGLDLTVTLVLLALLTAAAGLAGAALYLAGAWRVGAPEVELARRLVRRLRHERGPRRLSV